VVELHRSDRSYNSFLAGLILRGSRLFVIKANQDFDAIRRVRDKKATALSRRWANDATGAPLKTDANLASFSQFVRVTRELELTGMPTFHLQLLGSVYQILTHWRVAPKGLDVTLQWDWML